MKYEILDTNEIVTEEYLRKMLFEYETQDLLDNKKDFLDGSLNLDYQFNCIKKAVSGNMKEIIDRLETLWNVPIIEISDSKKISLLIDKKYEELCDKENVHNALDFITEIRDYLEDRYRIN